MTGIQVVMGGHDLKMALLRCGFEKWLYMGQDTGPPLCIGSNGISHFVSRQILDLIESRDNCLGHAANMAGDFAARDGRGDRAALAVAHHDDEAHMKVLDGVFYASDDVVIEDVAGVTDDEQIAQALIEEQLRGNTRVGAGEDNGERSLALGLFEAALTGLVRMHGGASHITLVSLEQPFESMFGRQGGQRVFICTSCRSRHRRGWF